VTHHKIPGIDAAGRVATVASTVAAVALANSGLATASMVGMLARIGGAVGAMGKKVGQEIPEIMPSGSHPDMDLMLTIDRF
jgi:hypothetical protein